MMCGGVRAQDFDGPAGTVERQGVLAKQAIALKYVQEMAAGQAESPTCTSEFHAPALSRPTLGP